MRRTAVLLFLATSGAGLPLLAPGGTAYPDCPITPSKDVPSKSLSHHPALVCRGKDSPQQKEPPPAPSSQAGRVMTHDGDPLRVRGKYGRRVREDGEAIPQGDRQNLDLPTSPRSAETLPRLGQIASTWSITRYNHPSRSKEFKVPWMEQPETPSLRKLAGKPKPPTSPALGKLAGENPGPQRGGLARSPERQPVDNAVQHPPKKAKFFDPFGFASSSHFSHNLPFRLIRRIRQVMSQSGPAHRQPMTI